MHKFLLNTLSLRATLRPDGPILVKSGSESATNPTLPDMNFVRTTHPQGGDTIYLPGSSLKGVMRSHAERIARTLNVDCCDPLDKDHACDSRFPKNIPASGPEIYQKVCTACRTFGHMVIASRFFVQDAYPRRANNQLPIRQMVAIDRRSSSSVNTFTMEVATEGEFEVNIVMRNFERWQVGLAALVLRDLREGYLRVGFGKSRGLGQVSLTFDRLHLQYTGVNESDPRLKHVLGTYQLADPTVRAQYNLLARPTDAEASDFVSGTLTSQWSGTDIVVEGDHDIEYVLRAQVSDWQHYVAERPNRA